MSLKFIREKGKLFLIRLSRRCKDGGSWKMHLIWNDDKGAPHTHPWAFKSMILFGGYKELSFSPDHGEFEGVHHTYGWLSVNTKEEKTSHLLTLRRFLGIRIPALTIGRYGARTQLCSLCTELGYCRTKGPTGGKKETFGEALKRIDEK